MNVTGYGFEEGICQAEGCTFPVEYFIDFYYTTDGSMALGYERENEKHEVIGVCSSHLEKTQRDARQAPSLN